MLLETIIRQTVELQGFRITGISKNDMGIIAHIAPDHRFSPRCGVCKTPGAHRDTRKERLFRHVPLWGIPVWFAYAPRRVFCKPCQHVLVEAFPWASGKRRFTKAFASFLAIWARCLPWLTVARHFHCSWGAISQAVEEVVEYGLAKRDLNTLTHIGIDEISRKKGHVYVTNVYDLATGLLVWSGAGRTKETLRQFFAFLGSERTAGLQGVCCDMWQPYVDVVREHAPQAVLVFDKFHVVRHLMEAVDQVRRDEIHEKGKAGKELLKDSRYIWLKNPWNLTDRQKSRLSDMEKLNLKINRAYLLKESFRTFWTYQSKPWAEKFLQKWFWWATHSRLQPLRDFAWLLRRHEDNILTYFDMPLNNGSVEGLNNKAKVISHRAYGFRSVKNFILNLYHCMADLPMPKLMHSFV